MVLDELASPGKMQQCDHGSMAAIHLGIGHITGWSVGDRVCQVAPPSQQANLYVILCQDDVISKKYCCFRIPYGRTRYVHLLLAHFCILVSDWLTLTFDP